MSFERIGIALVVVLGTVFLAGLMGNMVGEAVSEQAGQLASTVTIAVVAVIALIVFLVRWRARRGPTEPGSGAA